MNNHATALSQRSAELLSAHRQSIYRRTDRLFAYLMVCQWLAGIAAALWISPRTWIGAQSQIHLHVWAAIFLGGAITSFPVFLALVKSGSALTRHTIAIGQMLTSALLIHLSGGRIETHFHIFGSLAFLAMYRDWRVLVTATVVVTADHFLRGIFWPQSIFGVLAGSSWRWLEHAGWVIFEDACLWISMRQSLQQMAEIAIRRATLEEGNARIEREVDERTAELAAMTSGLQASEQRFRMLSASAPVGIFETDGAGLTLYTNERWQAIAGLSLSESLGDRWLSALHPDDAESVLDEWRRKARKGLAVEREFRFRRPDGQVRWVNFRTAAVRSAAGALLGHVGTVQDITKRKTAEAELERINRELRETSRYAGMAEVASSVLHNVGNVLNSTNVSLEVAADKVRGLKTGSLAKVSTLVSENSHDLPAFFATHPQGAKLPAFLGTLSAHFAEDQAAMLRELDSLRGNLEHINQIVATQQNYAGGGGLVEVVPIAEVIADALHMNHAALDRHGARVIREFDAALPSLAIDRHRVLQILVNLIRNAKHALDETPTAQRWLSVSAHVDATHCLHISVGDNGIGIAPENLARIFEHGFTTKKNGHGFGLHASALAARQMGGALHVTSSGPGLGAIFTLELPVPIHTA